MEVENEEHNEPSEERGRRRDSETGAASESKKTSLALDMLVGVCPLSGVHFAGLSLCIRRSFIVLLYILCKSLRLMLRTKLSCSTTLPAQDV